MQLRREALLGEGAFGVVYLVSDLKTGLFYALKIIKVTGLSEQKFFINEIDVLKEIEDICAPNMLCVKENTIYPEEIHILTDYVVGFDIKVYRKKLLNTVVDVDTATAFLTQIVPVIYQLQTRQIAHRDIKPANMIYNPATKNFTLIDFGLGVIEHATDFAGTPVWMSRLIVKNRESSTLLQWLWNDTFAVGAVLFFLLNSTYPFYLNKTRTGLNFQAKHPWIWNEDETIKSIVNTMLTGNHLAIDIINHYPDFFDSSLIYR